MNSLRKLLFLTLLCCAPAAWGQADLKIGVVNLDRILRESAPAQRAQKRIEAEIAKREQEMGKLTEQIKRLQEKSDKDALTASDSDRGRRDLELQELTREFQRKQREAREDINQRRNDELRQVLERANKVVRQIAEAEKFDIILQEAVYANPRIDITEKVVRAMDDSKQPGGK
jgi:outer membrane protein